MNVVDYNTQNTEGELAGLRGQEVYLSHGDGVTRIEEVESSPRNYLESHFDPKDQAHKSQHCASGWTVVDTGETLWHGVREVGNSSKSNHDKGGENGVEDLVLG